MTLIHSSGLWFESKLNQYLLNQINATEPTGLMLEAQEKADLVAFLKTLTDQSYLNNPDFASPF
jgi:cytochrome c peroxidase